MFWRNKKEINKLKSKNNKLEENLENLIKEQNKREKYVKSLEEQKYNLVIENEKLSNAIKEYGDLEIQNIQIPYIVNIKEETYIYGKNKWGGGELLTEPKLKQKIIPQIVINYYE